MENAALKEIHKGMSFGYLAKKGYYGSQEAAAQVEAMAELGVGWVALQVTIMQDTFASTRLYQDFTFTPSDWEVERIIGLLHQKGISVMLKPMVECQDSSWRGRICFPCGDQQILGRQASYWQAWFQSFTEALLHYGKMAQRTGCELYCLGCEMSGTLGMSELWRETIRQVKSVYSGPLTYDANGVRELDCDWYEDLALLCFSFYPPLTDKADATASQMAALLQPIIQQLRTKALQLKKPLLFGECGCRSVQGGAAVPSAYQNVGPYDGQVQANFLEAVLQSFWDEPWWYGLYWWKWDEQQARSQYEYDPAGDGGFTVAGKPAAETMRRWYAKPGGRELR